TVAPVVGADRKRGGAVPVGCRCERDSELPVAALGHQSAVDGDGSGDCLGVSPVVDGDLTSPAVGFVAGASLGVDVYAHLIGAERRLGVSIPDTVSWIVDHEGGGFGCVLFRVESVPLEKPRC